jgi:hypothetical protein
VRLLHPFLGRSGAVWVQVRQNPLTQQPHRPWIDGAGVLQQCGFHRCGMGRPVCHRDLFHGVRDRRRMLRADRTIRQGRSKDWVNRLQHLTGQSPPSTEPLHRQRPTTRLGASAPHLRRDQIRQPTQPQLTRHVPRLKLRQHFQLPELHPCQLNFQRPQLSQQLRIGSGGELFDHAFDFIEQGGASPSSTSGKPIYKKAKSA